MSTERLKLALAYDGRPFKGWQSQAHGGGVQDHLERAFAAVLGAPLRVHGAGRTDAGVHALEMIAHTDVPRGGIPLRQWPLALNAHLDHGVRVLRVTRARADFHARFDAKGKVYTYRVWNHHALHPLELGRAWHVPGTIDQTTLLEAARLLEGTHDFASYAAHLGQSDRNTVRTLHEVRVSRRGPLITLRFRGNGFLYHMVRLLTGTAVRCALGAAPLDWMRELLEPRAAKKTHYCAPAEGLYLTRVLY